MMHYWQVSVRGFWKVIHVSLANSGIPLVLIIDLLAKKLVKLKHAFHQNCNLMNILVRMRNCSQKFVKSQHVMFKNSVYNEYQRNFYY